ncbi:hypothetical protein PO124_25805 [Bacillus licheniformis]|nr:hypothetical protein [Bacillus licheniformis]
MIEEHHKRNEDDIEQEPASRMSRNSRKKRRRARRRIRLQQSQIGDGECDCRFVPLFQLCARYFKVPGAHCT